MPRTIIIRRNRERRRRGGEQRRRSLWFQLLLVALIGLGAAVGTAITASAAGLVAAYRYFSADLPSPEQVEELAMTSFETTKIYDRTGQHLLYEVVDPEAGDRTIIPLRDIPLPLRQATIALEDRTFYTNPGGINWEGLVRAFSNNLQGNPIQGGSSITAQLVRNVTMTPEERMSLSYSRKIKEAILSIELTLRYPGLEGRDKILGWYLNTVYYGNRAYGVEAASKVYFGKHAKDLTLAEAAMLANVPEYPAMNPIDNPEEAKKRQGLALQALVDQGYITQEQATEAWNAPVSPPPPANDQVKIEAPHFVMYILDVLSQRYGKNAVYGGGLRVITTLDYDLQNNVQNIVTKTVRNWPASSNAHDAAAVVIRPSTGEILAMVGSVDYFDTSIDGQVNMAVQPRQPGSSFKPYTYAAAFEQGYSPATMVYDVRTAFPIPGAPPYVPQNFDNSYHGPISLRRALACSYNIPAVIMANRIGIDSAVEMAHRLGITTIRDKSKIGLAVTLGAAEVSLLDHTYAFSVFANSGVMAGEPVPPDKREPGFRELDPVGVLRVTDGRGRVLEEFLGPTLKEVLDPQVAYQITSVLSDNNARTPAFGAVNPLVCSRPAAAKTGTTNDYRDCLTMGYNPQIAVGVWVGNANNAPMGSWYGAIAAAPIWHDIMEYAFKTLPPVDFVQPPGMKWVEVDAESGALPGPHTKSKVKDIFREGMAPSSPDTTHIAVKICRVSGKLATPYCPPDEVEEKVYTLYPTEAGDWVRNTKQPQPPTSYCDVHGPSLSSSDASITSPGIYQALKGTVAVTGNARSPGFHEYHLEYGPGLQPVEWFPVGGPHSHMVDNQVLENWDTSSLDGLYTLRLTVLGSQERQMTIPVTVDNTPPQIKIIEPLDQGTLIKETDYLNIQVDATDNMLMDQVQFLIDGQPVGESQVAPYTLGYDLKNLDTRAQGHTLEAIARDAAGNETRSAPIVFYVKHRSKDQ